MSKSKAKRPVPNSSRSAAPPAPRLESPRLTIGFAVVLALAATVRIWAAMDEFWLDEIWSLLDFAGRARSPAEVFLCHHDNNHYLVTLWMYLLGPLQANWPMYRIPSIAAGIGTVALAAQYARRWGTVAAAAAAVLTATSFYLITYASEARGYALEGFFALAALLALDRFLATRTIASNLVFVAAAILGTLSHLTFVTFFLVMLIWTAFTLYKRGESWPRLARVLAQLSIPVLLFFVALFLVDVRYMVLGGGTSQSIRHVVVNALALEVGFVSKSVWLLVSVALAVVVTLLTAIALLWRDKSDLWLLFLLAVFVAPGIAVTLAQPEFLYERYFYLSVLMGLLLLSYLAARIWRVGLGGRVAACAGIALLVAANAIPTSRFLLVGRGQFTSLLEYVADHTPEREISLASDGRRTRAVVYTQFYARYLKDRRIRFEELKPEMKHLPEWMMLGSGDQPYLAPAGYEAMEGRGQYRLVHVFPHSGLSGMSFALYHLSESPEEGSAASASGNDLPGETPGDKRRD